MTFARCATLQSDDAISTVARTGIILGASWVGLNLSAEQAVEYSQANHYLTHAEAGFAGLRPSGAECGVSLYARANSTLDNQPVSSFLGNGRTRNVVSVARVNYDGTHRLIAGLSSVRRRS